MTTPGAVIDGLDELEARLKALGDATAGEKLAKAALAGVLVIEGEIRRIIQSSPASGRVYKRGNVLHRASAPGEPPAIDTATLLNSISSEVTSQKPRRAVAITGPNTEYAAPLELGTSRMAARPYMRPAADGGKDRAVDAAVTVLVVEIEAVLP